MIFKRIALLSVLSMLLLFAGCDNEVSEVQVPDAVQAAFIAEFPAATDVEWEMDGRQYEVDFKLDGEHHEAKYDAEGNVIGTH